MENSKSGEAVESNKNMPCQQRASLAILYKLEINLGVSNVTNKSFETLIEAPITTFHMGQNYKTSQLSDNQS